MKLKILFMALFAGLLCMNASAQWSQFGSFEGYQNVWTDIPDYLGGTGTYELTSGTVPDVADLQAIAGVVDHNYNFLPNIARYTTATNSGIASEIAYWTNSDDGGSTPGPDGGKWVENAGYWSHTMSGAETNVIVDFTINSSDLDPRYDSLCFIKVLNPSSNWDTTLNVAVTNVSGVTGSFQFSAAIPVSEQVAGRVIQFGHSLGGTNANPSADWGAIDITFDDVLIEAPDADAPTPDPMTFAAVPTTVSDDKITMTATTATDINPVQYYFTCVENAAFDSGWIDSPVYRAEGLAPSTTYNFNVKARDLATAGSNTNTPSANFDATTVATDTTKPSPDPAEIAAGTASPVSLWLVASPASDASDVEYNFVPDNTNYNAVASGWQSSNEYIAYGLVPGAPYSYTVQVRDLSAITNTTALSDAFEITLPAAPVSASFTNSLQGFTPGDSSQGAMLTELGNAGFELVTLDTAKLVVADGAGLTFGDINEQTFESRNVFRTIAADYGDTDFQISVSFNSYSNAIEQVCFLGVGHGIQGQYNIPDFFATGVSGVESETKAGATTLWSWFEGALQDSATTNGVTALTNRVRMTYDSTAETVLLEVDWDDDGFGGFVADETVGPVSTTNVWQTGAPQKVYISAGAGVTLYDLEVVYAGATPVAATNLTITSVSGDTATLQWSGLNGQSYSVQHKTDLGDATWTTDPGNTGILGVSFTQSTTVTTAGDEVFYRLESE